MPDSAKVFGFETNHARWPTLALEGAAITHWASGLPPAVAESSRSCRRPPRRFSMP
jgi:hypothetical protein